MSIFKRKPKPITMIHGDEGKSWAFDKSKYVGHFRSGDKVFLLLDGAPMTTLQQASEEDAIEQAKRLTTLMLTP